MKTFQEWMVDEGLMKNLAMGGALAAGIGGGATAYNQFTANKPAARVASVEQPRAAKPAQGKPDDSGFTDNPKQVVQQRKDQILGFSMKQKDANTVIVHYNASRLTDEQAMEMAIKRLPGGYDSWDMSGSGDKSGISGATLVFSRK